MMDYDIIPLILEGLLPGSVRLLKGDREIKITQVKTCDTPKRHIDLVAEGIEPTSWFYNHLTGYMVNQQGRDEYRLKIYCPYFDDSIEENSEWVNLTDSKYHIIKRDTFGFSFLSIFRVNPEGVIEREPIHIDLDDNWSRAKKGAMTEILQSNKPEGKVWSSSVMDYVPIPNPGDIVKAELYKDMLMPSKYTALGIVRSVDMGTGKISICAEINPRSGNTRVKKAEIPVGDYTLTTDGEKAFAMESLKKHGLTIEGLLIKRPLKVGDYILVREDSSKHWELAQYAWIEPYIREYVHIIGGKYYRDWLPYEGNEDKLGKICL